MLSAIVPMSAQAGSDYGFCPPARGSASHLHWRAHRIAPGVRLESTTMRGDRGKV
ncbi:MAG: hypothetical protein ACTHK4_00670 [Mycobacteriales bacterium]